MSEKTKKRTPRGPKMVPKIDPKWSQNCSWGSPGTLPGQLSPNFESQGPFWIHFGTPKEPQNRLKMRLSGKMVVPGRLFSRFLQPTLFFLNLFLDFLPIFLEKTTKNPSIFCTAGLVFFNLANTQIHRQGQCFQHFSRFLFY